MTSAAKLEWNTPQSLPRRDWLLEFLGFSPAPTGFYGTEPALPLRVAANDQPTLSRLAASSENFNILALDTGGFSLENYLALHPITRSSLESALGALPTDERSSLLLLPTSLADTLQLKPDAILNGIPIEVIASPSPANPSPFAVILRLALGQMLLWALPLLVFGWQSLLWGVAALLAGGLLLGILWQHLPFSPWARGLCVGFILSTPACLWLSLANELAMPGVVFYFFGLALPPTWLGLLSMGGKS